MGECIITRRGGRVVCGTATGKHVSSASGGYASAGIYCPELVGRTRWVLFSVGRRYVQNTYDYYITRLQYEHGVYVCDYNYKKESDVYTVAVNALITDEGGIRMQRPTDDGASFFQFYPTEYQYFAW